MKAFLGGALAMSILALSPAMAEGVEPLPAVCSPGSVLRDITFEIKREDGRIGHFIEFRAPEESLARLQDPDTIVLPCREVVVVIDYPVDEEVKFTLAAPSAAGFSRVEIARQIVALYQRMYREEEESTKIAVLPPGERGELANRNRTNGKYGIWGHDITDLAMNEVGVGIRNGVVYVTLAISS